MKMDRLYILTGFLWLIAGMTFGIYLGITDQLQFANSHAHANLLGFVISVLFGLIYRAWPVLMTSRLALPQFALFEVGSLVLVAGKYDIDGGGGGMLAPPDRSLSCWAHSSCSGCSQRRRQMPGWPRRESGLMPTRVQDHYGADRIVERILAAAEHSTKDAISLPADRLFPYDQLHGRELLATRDHAAMMNPASDTHLLDLGSGIGGPARYFASVFGCRVTGIDLTPQFVAAATELTRLTGLAGTVDFVEGDVAKLPFQSGTFDHAYCFYVGMNLADKPAVMRECSRVLKPGGSLLWTEVTSKAGEPHYPLPWAVDAPSSHVGASDMLADQLREAGFDLVSIDDETDAHVELAHRMKTSGSKPTEAHLQANEVVLGAGFVERRMNYIRSLSEGALASTVIYGRKAGKSAGH